MLLRSANLSPQDRRFVTQLVFGVIRRKGTLDALLKPFIKHPGARRPTARLGRAAPRGVPDCVFLTHVPKHAAVNETVELAAHVGSPKAKGFINGVMRRVAELVTDEFTDKPGAATVPFDGRPNPQPPSLRGRGASRAPPSLRGGAGGGVFVTAASPAPSSRSLHCARCLLRDRVLAPEVARGPLARPLRPRGMHAARLLVQHAAAIVDSRQQAAQRSRDVSPATRRGTHRRRTRRTSAIAALARSTTRSATCPATTPATSRCRITRRCSSPRRSACSRGCTSSTCAPPRVARRRTSRS